MKLGVLGELLVDLNGATVELRPAERRLVAGLAVERPSGVRYDALAEAVWGDRVPATAKHSLQSHVRRIRAVTGDGLVQTVAGGYRLGTDVQVDVDAFESAIEGAGAADDEAPTLWAEALSWWRGPPFVDLDDWAPAVAERARLTELWNRAVEECCAAGLATSDPTTVIAEAERLVHAEPLRERRWALLMTALAAAGRRPEALRTFDRARRTLATELGISPGAELAQLHEALVRDDAETIAAVHRVFAHNLPIQLTPLIGRASEIADVLGQLVDERLVTLTGSAGVGKTRLALAAAAAVSATYSGGVWLVELAATADPADVEPLVATALRFAPGAGLSVRASIIDGIGDRALLVVLDNCEHLLDAVADFAHETLRRCPRLRILATSRERLGVDGERVVRVPSLSVDSDAIELFIDRARNADASFRADPRVVVEQICQRLDGIPLAIELAAARVRTLRLSELASRLDEHLDVLTAGRHGRVERHQTLRAALDWSWGLLDDDERTAFGRLSVFAGNFDMEAANAVSGGTPLGDDVVDVLAALVDKSMVLADLRHAAPFRLLEPLRQYGAEQLAAHGDTADFARRHARYYAGLGARLAGALFGPDEIDVAARLGAARANLRAAFAFAVASEDADLALSIVAPLGRYTSFYIWPEPWSWCRVALGLPGADAHPLRALTLSHASRGAWQIGDHTGALALADQAVSLADRGSATWCEAQIARANALVFLGRLDDADAAATAAVEIGGDDADGGVLQRVGTMLFIRFTAGRPEPEATRQLLERARTSSPTTYAWALVVAALVLQDDDRAAAIEWNQHAAELAAATGAVLMEGFVLITRATLEAAVDAASSARSYVAVMTHFLRVGNRAHVRVHGRGLIGPLVACGAYEAAATVDGATRRHAVVPFDAITAPGLDEGITQARAELGPSYDAAATRGEKLTDDDLLHYLQAVAADL